jgi:hypothetical protein
MHDRERGKEAEFAMGGGGGGGARRLHSGMHVDMVCSNDFPIQIGREQHITMPLHATTEKYLSKASCSGAEGHLPLSTKILFREQSSSSAYVDVCRVAMAT